MKKFVLLAVLVAAMPLTTMAQDDDLYFNPKQEAKKEAALREQRAKAYARVRAVRDSLYAIYWSGSPRSVDEYNRNGRILSHYQGITTDSLGNDIISFRLEKGVKPDSIYDDEAFAQKFINQDEDFEYTRDLSRWDGYYNPWFYDYYGVGPYYVVATGAGEILGAMVITQVGTTHGLTHSTILGITDMLAGMEVGILLGMDGVDITILGTGVVR